MKINHAYKMHNLPFRATVQDYESICAEIVRQAKSNESVSAVYLMGGKWRPGISDIDILVVYKHALDPLPGPHTISPLARRIFTHRYIAFPERLFPYFYYIYPKETTHITLLWGRETNMRNPESELSPKEYLFLRGINVVDVMINKVVLFSGYREKWKHKGIDVRKVLGDFYSLAYTATLVERITGKSVPHFFPQRIDVIRREWSTNGHVSPEQFLALLSEAENMVLDLIQELHIHFREEQDRADEAIFCNKQYSIYFKKDWKREEHVGLFNWRKITVPFTHKVFEHFSFTLPSTLVPFVACQGKGGQPFSSLISASWKTDPDINNYNIYQKCIEEYATTKNDLFSALVETKGFYRVPFLYGFSLFDVNKKVLAGLLKHYFSFFTRW